MRATGEDMYGARWVRGHESRIPSAARVAAVIRAWCINAAGAHSKKIRASRDVG